MLSVIFISCNNDFITENIVEETIENKSRLINSHSENYELMKDFAIALHRSMSNNPDVRYLLKTEALREINFDFDVLYNKVKYQQVGQNTFKDDLLNYISLDRLNQIEETLPTLTIFIPELPDNSFSALNWDTSNVNPLVAVRALNSPNVPIFHSEYGGFLLDGDVVPGFPVVVIKDNERVIDSSNPFINRRRKVYSSEFGSLDFQFISDNFDNIEPVNDPPPYVPPSNCHIPCEIIEAWERYGKEENTGWHRDFIYYGLEPNTTEGPFINNFQERIMRFTLKEDPDPAGALSNISQPSTTNDNFSDPELQTITYPNGGYGNIGGGPGANFAGFWTDGNFEFGYQLNLYAENGPTLVESSFSAHPYELFNISYGGIPVCNFYAAPGSGLHNFLLNLGLCDYSVYTPQVSHLRQKSFPTGIPLDTWNLEHVSNRWELAMQEIDTNIIIEETESRTSKFNANFGLTGDSLWGKLGLKLGASAESTKQTTFKSKYTLDSDNLGNTIINFGDNIIVGQNPWRYRWHGNTKFEVYLRPYRSQ